MSEKAKVNVDLTGLKRAEAMDLLIGAGLKFSDATKYWEAHRPAGTKRGYQAEFRDLLRKGPMSDAEFKEWVKEIAKTNPNVKRGEKIHDDIRKLANDIWASVKKPAAKPAAKKVGV